MHFFIVSRCATAEIYQSIVKQKPSLVTIMVTKMFLAKVLVVPVLAVAVRRDSRNQQC